MSASSRPSSSTDVVDEPLLRSIAAEFQGAIPDAEVQPYSCGEAFGYGYGSRARGTARLLAVFPLTPPLPSPRPLCRAPSAVPQPT